MTYKEESYVLDTLRRIRDQTEETNKLVKENNVMLKQIIRYLAYEAKNANKENEEDFGRNVLANMFSNQLEFINNNHKHKRYGIY